MLVRGESSSTKSRNDFLKRESRLSRMDGESFLLDVDQALGKKESVSSFKISSGKLFENV